MTKSQIENKIRTLNAKLYNLERAEAKKDNSKFEGRYFKYHNSFNGEDRWWIYIKVVGIADSGRYLKTIQFQTMNDGRMEAHANDGYSPSMLQQEIKAVEFENAWYDFKQKLTDLLP